VPVQGVGCRVQGLGVGLRVYDHGAIAGWEAEGFPGGVDLESVPHGERQVVAHRAAFEVEV